MSDSGLIFKVNKILRKIKQNLGENNNPKSKEEIFIVKVERQGEAGNHHSQSGREITS